MPPRSRLALFWTLVILALCWTPRMYMKLEERTPAILFIPNIDKLVHMGIFVVFAVLWMRVGSSPRRTWWVLLAGLAMAIITELGQELEIVRRDANVYDGLADSLGVVVGLGAFELARKWPGKQSTRVEV